MRRLTCKTTPSYRARDLRASIQCHARQGSESPTPRGSAGESGARATDGAATDGAATELAGGAGRLATTC